MLTMWHDRIFICLEKAIRRFTRPFILRITTLIFKFFKKRSRNDNNDECMLLEDMQHSQQHMTLYQEVIFLSWGGKI